MHSCVVTYSDLVKYLNRVQHQNQLWLYSICISIMIYVNILWTAHARLAICTCYKSYMLFHCLPISCSHITVCSIRICCLFESIKMILGSICPRVYLIMYVAAVHATLTVQRVYIVLCVLGWHLLRKNTLGPNPTGFKSSPNGCQSLQVTWTHRAPTSPLTLIHYRLRYWAQGGSQQTVTTTSQGSYTLTGLAPATTYTVIVEAQTQLGYGYYSPPPTATTHNGEASSDV